MTAAIAEAYNEDPLDVMKWPLRKRLFYIQMVNAHPERRAAREQGRDQQQSGQQPPAPAQTPTPTSAPSPSATPTPSTANLPNGLDPADVPTPPGVENPYADAQQATAPATSPQQSAGSAAGTQQRLSDASQHPKVARHDSVVNVVGDPTEEYDEQVDLDGIEEYDEQVDGAVSPDTTSE